jgi:oligopeptide transport system ATP-binding protein
MALLCRPKLLIADEPTTALDVTVQAQILALLQDLRREFSTSIILITHDLGVVAGVCDSVLVMYAGRVMEYGDAPSVFADAAHPYTRGLLHAVPRLDRRHADATGANNGQLNTIPGNPPNLLALPPGCPFVPRCIDRTIVCVTAPQLEDFGQGRRRACHRAIGDLTVLGASVGTLQ